MVRCDEALVVVGIHRLRVAAPLEIVDAAARPRGLPGLAERGHQHRGEDRDDRDHDQKLDQREARRLASAAFDSRASETRSDHFSS